MDKLWGHCLFYGAYGTDEHGKFIAFPNSWGQIVDRPQGPWQPGMAPGYGWQKLRLNYFTKELQFNPWTYTDKPAEVVDPTTVPADFAHVFNTPLYFGMKNAEVIALQTALSLNGHLDPKCITGYYGPLTAAAVLEFQLVNNVDTVNILTQLKGRQVGPKTLLMLNRMFSVSK